MDKTKTLFILLYFELIRQKHLYQNHDLCDVFDCPDLTIQVFYLRSTVTGCKIRVKKR